VRDEFLRKLAAKVEMLRSGSGLEAGVTQGPLIDEAAVNHVDSLVQDAVEKGAKVLTGGKRHKLGGLFYEPTVLTDVTPAMRVFREEIFGPVAPVAGFASEKEAIALAKENGVGIFKHKGIGRDDADPGGRAVPLRPNNRLHNEPFHESRVQPALQM